MRRRAHEFSDGKAENGPNNWITSVLGTLFVFAHLWCLWRLIDILGWVKEPAMTSTQVAQFLGTSRQHVADLADRGMIPCWRTGTHRRFRRADVVAYQERTQGRAHAGILESMNLTDRRSLAYGLLIAKKLVVAPDPVLGQARRNLARQRTVHTDGSADRYLNAWAELLAGPTEAILNVLTSTDQRSVALRHAAPFAGVLTDADRRSVIRSTRRTAA